MNQLPCNRATLDTLIYFYKKCYDEKSSKHTKLEDDELDELSVEELCKELIHIINTCGLTFNYKYTIQHLKDEQNVSYPYQKFLADAYNQLTKSNQFSFDCEKCTEK